MAIYFNEQGHTYESINSDTNINWISVTKFIALFKPKFDSYAVALKSSLNPNSKWYSKDPKEIVKIWEREGDRSIKVGNLYHGERESDVINLQTLQRNGIDLPIFKPIINDGLKYAPDQKLKDGIYPEHMVYLKSKGLCGQIDRAEVYDNTVHIIDYKTSKEIKTSSAIGKNGDKYKMLHSCSHLDDCNYNHYALQLSLYMYIVLKHNHNLKPGKLTLQHVKFEKESDDEYGYPILKLDRDNNPIIKDIDYYDLPYMKEEVISMINWYEQFKDNL